MIVYFRKYTIFVCVIAVALPVIVSTVWPLFTGQMMAASIGGLVLMFALFVLGLLFGYAIFEKHAEGIVDGYLSKYNEGCDPEALISEGAQLADEIKFPCNQIGSWFMGYYAQALLDVGDVERAKAISDGLRQSMEAAKTSEVKAGIMANLLPLSEKLDGSSEALELADKGIEHCNQIPARKAGQLSDFFSSQKKILEAQSSDDQAAIARLSESIRASALYPMRIRVEYAWDEARAEYKLGDVDEEKRCLRFVSDYGNKLALVAKAQQRLASLG